ncbi:hypothetical protein Q9Q94_05240 [Uliginosibacterium sp. 31-16]|uniref:hypothetical protein n=1 Tax=Uliginosibacterium sp. 31-16 TaxID=3068315 RepID=UPI00273E7010|nr:hypothetical protein [Uliginosibacterium sp. 31-16]MDP5238922.1 hypothetical protein [Uliginosibacterium sp. 31-16]
MKGLILGLALAATCTAVQAAPATVFSSRYTDLGKDCKTPAWVEQERLAWEMKYKGKAYPEQDPEVMECKAVGRWRANIQWSAVGMTLYVGPSKQPQRYAEDIVVGNRLGEGRSRAPLEWRLANGVPFAVIFRVQQWQDNPRWPDAKGAPQFIVTSENIAVRGLGALSGLNAELPAGDPQANLKARQMADAAFDAAR